MPVDGAFGNAKAPIASSVDAPSAPTTNARREILGVFAADAGFVSCGGTVGVFAEDEEKKPTTVFRIGKGNWIKVSLPAALTSKPPAEWIFWPSGTCEPATVQFRGPAGAWTANYSPLTAQPDLTQYATR